MAEIEGYMNSEIAMVGSIQAEGETDTRERHGRQRQERMESKQA